MCEHNADELKEHMYDTASVVDGWNYDFMYSHPLSICDFGYVIPGVTHDDIDCVECTNGTTPNPEYTPTNDKVRCKLCATGEYTFKITLPRATIKKNLNSNLKRDAITVQVPTCTKCAAGRYLSANWKTRKPIMDYVNKQFTMCDVCPYGFYQDEEGKTSCKWCGANKITGRLNNINYATLGTNNWRYTEELGTEELGIKEKFEYQRGLYTASLGWHLPDNRDKCEGCPVGKKGIVTSDNIPVAPTQYCTTCTPGMYQNELGQGTCKDCAAGKYQDESGKPKCKTCAAGKYQDQQGQVTCKDCHNGGYQDQTGQNTCKTCETGYSTEAGKAATSCICDVGYSGDPENDISCLKCTAGGYNNIKGLKTSCRDDSGRDEEQCAMNASIWNYECADGSGRDEAICTKPPSTWVDGCADKSGRNEWECTKPPSTWVAGKCADESGRSSSFCVLNYDKSGKIMDPSTYIVDHCADGSGRDGHLLSALNYAYSECTANASTWGYCADDSGRTKTHCTFRQSTWVDGCEDNSGRNQSECRMIASTWVYGKCADNSTRNQYFCETAFNATYHSKVPSTYIVAHCADGSGRDSRQKCEGQQYSTWGTCADGSGRDEEHCTFGQSTWGKCADGSGRTQSQCALNASYIPRICNLCLPGKYQDELGNTECKQCGKDKYQDEPGKTECKQCGSGKYQDEPGMDECKQCPTGTFKYDTGDNITCESCPAGKHSDTPGAIVCRDCPAGWHQPEDHAENCYPCECEMSDYGNQPYKCRYQDEIGQTRCKFCTDKVNNTIYNNSTTIQIGIIGYNKKRKRENISVTPQTNANLCFSCDGTKASLGEYPGGLVGLPSETSCYNGTCSFDINSCGTCPNGTELKNRAITIDAGQENWYSGYGHIYWNNEWTTAYKSHYIKWNATTFQQGYCEKKCHGGYLNQSNLCERCPGLKNTFVHNDAEWKKQSAGYTEDKADWTTDFKSTYSQTKNFPKVSIDDCICPPGTEENSNGNCIQCAFGKYNPNYNGQCLTCDAMVNGARTSCDWSTCLKNGRRVTLYDYETITREEYHPCDTYEQPSAQYDSCINYQLSWTDIISKVLASQDGYSYCKCEDGYGFFEDKEKMTLKNAGASWNEYRVVAYHCNACPVGRSSKI
jgi:hypothetical protein